MQTFCGWVCVCVCCWGGSLLYSGCTGFVLCLCSPPPGCDGDNVWFQYPIYCPPPTPPLYLHYCSDRMHPPSLQLWWGWRGGGERKKVRLLNGVGGKMFPLHLFPCTVQDLWSCLKAYFLYRFVWLDNRLWTSLSALQQIRVQKSHFFLLED